jgi:hypothetical protein
VGAILFVSAVNYLGVRPGALLQNLFPHPRWGRWPLIVAGLAAAGVAEPWSHRWRWRPRSPPVSAPPGPDSVHLRRVAADQPSPRRSSSDGPCPHRVPARAAWCRLSAREPAYLRVLARRGSQTPHPPPTRPCRARAGRRKLIAAGIAASPSAFSTWCPGNAARPPGDGGRRALLPARPAPRCRTPAAAIGLRAPGAIVLT